MTAEQAMTRTQPLGLNGAEATRLTRLERILDRAVEVAGKIAGEALSTIRDERLYRVTHSTFEAYVLDRWGFSRFTAYRMIAAAAEPEPKPEREPKPKPPTLPPEEEPEPSTTDSGFVAACNKPSTLGPRVVDPEKPDLDDDEADPTNGAGDDKLSGQDGNVDTWAEVVDVGGGEMRLLVSRELASYPEIGQWVWVSW